MIHRMDPPVDPDREPMPERLQPMLARIGPLPPDTEGRWGYEVKWDGIRALAWIEGGRVRLCSPQRQRHHRALPGAARARAGAGRAPGDPRRRDRRLRRRGPAELRAPAVAHAPGQRGRGAPRRARHPRRLRALRRPLPRRPHDVRAALHGAPRPARGARAARPALADPRLPDQGRRGAAAGQRRARARGRRGQAAGLALRARAAGDRLGQGQEQAPPVGGDRRLAARRGAPQHDDRRPARGRAGRGRRRSTTPGASAPASPSARCASCRRGWRSCAPTSRRSPAASRRG